MKQLTPKEDNITTRYPHERLMKAVVVVAMKDYVSEDIGARKMSLDWVKGMLGTFDLCAVSMKMPPEKLQKVMLEKMKAIDKGENLYKFRESKKHEK